MEKIIVSEDVGKEGYDETIVMPEYLITKGIAKPKIIIDSNGINTHKSAKFAGELISNKVQPIISVSQQYHISKAKLSLRNTGFSEVYGYFPQYYSFLDIYAYTREIPVLRAPLKIRIFVCWLGAGARKSAVHAVYMSI